MRVILGTTAVFPFHGHGGVEKYPYYFAKSLAHEGIDVKIVSSLDNGCKRTEYFDSIRYDLIPPMVYLRKPTGPWSVLYNISLNKYLQNESFEILHSFSTTSYVYQHFKKCPVIVQPFGLELFTAPSIKEMKGLKKLYIDIFGKSRWYYCIQNADKIALEGDFQYNDIIEIFKINNDKIFTLPVGIDIEHIHNQIKMLKIQRKDLGISDEELVLISVNRFIPDKGLLYLIDAFAQIQSEIDAKLILIGRVQTKFEIEYYNQVVDSISKYNLQEKVILLKNVEEDSLYDYYILSDIYVSPTLHDDFIMSIQEAMVCGLPIVSTGQAFSMQDTVNGYIIQKKDPNALVSSIRKLYDQNSRKKMGCESQKIVKQFDFKIIAKLAIKQYEKMI